jgi:carbamoyl-phosphate synthase large subunit
MLREADPTVRVIGTSSLPLTPGFHHCDANYVLPPIASDEYPEVVAALCKTVDAAAILSFYDVDIDRLSAHLDLLSASGTVPIIAGKAVSDICYDKLKTVAYLDDKGFAGPLTFATLAAAEQALSAGDVDFPLMVKPRRGFGSNDLFRANNIEQLRVFFHYRKNTIIQAMLRGQEYGIDVLSDLEGKAISVAVKQKLAMRSGETDQAVCVRHVPLEDMAVKLVETLGATGPFDIDVFLTGQGPFILELNPRFGGGYLFSHLAGADHPGKILRLLKGEKFSLEAGIKRTGQVFMKDIGFLVGEPVATRFPAPSTQDA